MNILNFPLKRGEAADCPICGQPLWFVDKNGSPLAKVEGEKISLTTQDHPLRACEHCGEFYSDSEAQSLRDDLILATLA